MTQEQSIPSLNRFEQAVKAKDYEQSCNELLAILEKIDGNFGKTDGIEFSYPAQLQGMEDDIAVYFCTRMATAVTELFTDRELVLNEGGFRRFMVYQRWLALIFASSPYINADHVLAAYNVNPEPDSLWNNFHLDGTHPSVTYKFCIMYLPDSNVALDYDALWALDANMAASLLCALQSPRFIGTEEAFAKRGEILQWVPEKFKQLDNLLQLPSGILHDVYMHCSYDIAANKHDIKAGVNHLVRRFLVKEGIEDRVFETIGYRNGKPVIVVLLEHFNELHSIYRTHSTSMRAAREHFYLIGMGSEAVDEAGRSVFDEFHVLDMPTIASKLQYIRQTCEQNNPSVLYMPSIGMDLLTVFASNLRLAPIQAIALGHPATTHSEFIDYVVVEDDYVGSEECFSETLLRLPKDALPYVPSASAPVSVDYYLNDRPDVVHIGVASTTMKLNPYFLKACQAIRDRASVKIHFHFALGQSIGITHPYAKRFIKKYLGNDATVYRHQDYPSYMRALYQCDMMINPFPFGNTNGIIDMVTLGLVGVCKTGPEVHEHIDEGLFKRLGLPEWLVTETVDEYVACAIRLAENHQERLALRRHIIENNGLQTLFSGDPSPMGKVFMEKLQQWAADNGMVLENAAQPEKKRAPARRKTAAEKAESAESQAAAPKKKAASAKKEPSEKPVPRKRTTAAKTSKGKSE